MNRALTIALDAMGGDRAPDVVLRGADVALERFPEVQFRIFGPEAQMREQLAKLPRLRQRVELVHTDIAITGEMKPAVALRSGRGSSMRLAIDAVAQGQAAAMVSAGNTGALMAMAKIALRTMPGIDRPAIASFFPTERGESVMLDLGANLDCDARNLLQFAMMGDAFARSVLGLTAPSIGLLNVGSEEMKGGEILKEAAALIRATPLAAQFRGFVEGDDIAAGTVDVIVTDGFSGNVALKTAEGTARLMATFLRQAFRHSLWAKLGYLFARPAIAAFKNRIDPRRYNGAMFLGLNGIAVKSHGGTDALGFANAIAVAVDLSVHGFMSRIRDELAVCEPDAAAARG